MIKRTNSSLRQKQATHQKPRGNQPCLFFPNKIWHLLTCKRIRCVLFPFFFLFWHLIGPKIIKEYLIFPHLIFISLYYYISPFYLVHWFLGAAINNTLLCKSNYFVYLLCYIFSVYFTYVLGITENINIWTVDDLFYKN